ncbi:MAG TPA: tRNA pseudouridine synthase A, partial [Phaeodactylibacter sp.]|nr:tRNA pseudouridine synthase A [Phaeodactylibacter sp.]
MRYFATISYQGTQYSGWQIQPNAPSVQKCIEQKLSILLRKPCPVVGCGRTDAGVHAKNYVLHFDADQNLDKTFLFRLNKMLPEDIVFHAIRHVQNKAHARFDARYRAYRYFLIAD